MSALLEHTSLAERGHSYVNSILFLLNRYFRYKRKKTTKKTETFPKPIPFPERKRPTPSFKDLGDILRERELIEVFDKELGRNVFVSKIKVLEDEGRYSPTRRAGGGMAGIRRPSAIPPESGPQSQGLASLKKYGSYY